MKSLKHNGILVLPPPEAHGLSIIVCGEEIKLTPEQEEMAVAWVKKLGTPYVKDPVFIANFMRDFSKALGKNPTLKLEDVDFGPVIEFVERERAKKEAMTKEEKKAAREQRKAIREALKEKYGYVWVDGERMELSNYQTEPSGIFMGRGEHPLRGRWKRGATHKDITLNLSPDAEVPEGDWGAIVWEPECMWVAKWTDELTGKTKYIWLHDSTPIKQAREAQKFDKALRLGKREKEIREHIMNGLRSDNPKRRMVAAACYLIDRLSLRVGDEKDPDEADTVGATTLRVEHLKFRDNVIIFDFLGKDSVPWHKELEVPPDVFAVFKELYDKAADRVESFKTREGKKTKADPKKISQIFPSIRSSHVNRFLGEIDKALTAKVFRTFHATKTMEQELKKQRVKKTDYEYIKKAAFKRANLEVARVLNHTKQAPKGWSKTAERYKARLAKADERIAKAKENLATKKKQLRVQKKKAEQNIEKKKAALARARERVETAKARVAAMREKHERAREALARAKAQKKSVRESKRKGKRTKKERLAEVDMRLEKVKKQVEAAEAALKKAKEQYEKSKAAEQRAQQALAKARESAKKRVEKAQHSVAIAKERVKKAEVAKDKIRTDFQLAKLGRTWNLGTSLKSYIHPKIVYKWCQRVEYDWRKVYPKTLQRKFAWVEAS